MNFVVYNKETGELIMAVENTEYDAQCTNIEVPEGMILTKFEDGEPVFIEKPLTMEERIAMLEEQNMDQDDALVELSDTIFNLY